MKFALIAQPLNGDRLVSQYKLTYHMALAQYVLQDPAYAAFYQALHKQDHFIMLDNGAAENGHSIGIENVVRAAEMIDADEIIMPDVLDESRATIAATLAARQYVPERMRAVVPQGRDWEEWQDCALALLEFKCRTICVAKRYEALKGGRAYALKLIEDNGWHKTYNVHLLGCYRNPLGEIRNARKVAPWVRGIDTGAPIAYAQHGAILDHSRRYSLTWNGPFHFLTAEVNMELILEACRAHNT